MSELINESGRSFRTDFLEKLQKDPTKEISISGSSAEKNKRLLDFSKEYYQEAREQQFLSNYVQFFRVSIFGSARLEALKDKEYEFTKELARQLVLSREINIVTGGGPGIMQAAHEGLMIGREALLAMGKKAETKNVGVGIDLPFEEGFNPEVHIGRDHKEFSTRLQDFVDLSHGAYNAPGGYGTPLEMLYFLQLKQIGHLEKDFPILVHPFWTNFLDTLNDTVYHQRVALDKKPLVNESDIDLVQITDSIPEIVAVFTKKFDDWKKHFRDRVVKIA